MPWRAMRAAIWASLIQVEAQMGFPPADRGTGCLQEGVGAHPSHRVPLMCTVMLVLNPAVELPVQESSIWLSP